jgi:hypothetical protein
MKTALFALAAVLALPVLSSLAAPVEPAKLNTLTPAEAAKGWKLLWDGRTTNGWHTADGRTVPNADWTIADGVLQVHADGGKGSGHGGDLISDEDFTDFELSIDFKLTPEANSGIKYFVNPDKAHGGDPYIGLEYQLLDDDRHPDAKLGRDGDRTEASLYDLIPAAKSKPYRSIGEWNTAKIVVRVAHTEHWLNGVKVVDFERFTPEFRKLVAESKYKDLPNFGELHHGHLQLQDHGDGASFRNLKIRILK